jgi:hypothetical protein
VLAGAWDDRALLFWSGLKRRALHASCPKRPVGLKELLDYQRARLRGGSSAGLRDAAQAAVCFFGIRRSSEALALCRNNVSAEEDALRVWIARQKNDPNGRGMVCWIPRVPDLGDVCPFALLSRWLELWDRCFGDIPESPLFCVTGRPGARAVSYDSWRKSLAAFFGDRSVGTHSLRKGGAQWFRNELGVREDVVQAQGGWASVEVMRRVYAEIPAAARRSLLVGAARAGSCASASAAPVQEALPEAVASPAVLESSDTVANPVWELEEHVQCDACHTWHSVDEATADNYAGDAAFRCCFLGLTCDEAMLLD